MLSLLFILSVLPLSGSSLLRIAKTKAEKQMIAEWKKVRKNPDNYIAYHGGGLHHEVTWRLLVANADAPDAPDCLLLGQKDKVVGIYSLTGRRYNEVHRKKSLLTVETGDWIVAEGFLEVVYGDSNQYDLHLNCRNLSKEKN